VTPKKLVFLGVLGLKKTISSYSFDRIVLIFTGSIARSAKLPVFNLLRGRF